MSMVRQLGTRTFTLKDQTRCSITLTWPQWLAQVALAAMHLILTTKWCKKWMKRISPAMSTVVRRWSLETILVNSELRLSQKFGLDEQVITSKKIVINLSLHLDDQLQMNRENP